MGDPVITPMLIGAGVGALGGVVTGNNPLKTAALGATIGGTGGAAGAWGGGQAAVAKGAGSSIIPQSAGAFEASMGLPQTTAAIESAGMVMNPATGTLLNPEYYAGAQSPLATYTGGEGLFSNAMGNIGSSIEDIKPYFNVQNLQGAAMVANQFQPRPMPSSSGGRITQGQAPAPALGGNIQTLLARMPERKRISLLV